MRRADNAWSRQEARCRRRRVSRSIWREKTREDGNPRWKESAMQEFVRFGANSHVQPVVLIGELDSRLVESVRHRHSQKLEQYPQATSHENAD